MAETTPQENKEVVRRFIDEVINGKNRDLVEELFTDDYTRHDVQGMPEVTGRDSFVETLELLDSAFPDGEIEIREMIAEDDLVAFVGVERGTHEGAFMGIEPTGEPFEITGNAMHRVRDGKISETWATWDMLGMLQQVGAAPAPEPSD